MNRFYVVCVKIAQNDYRSIGRISFSLDYRLVTLYRQVANYWRNLILNEWPFLRYYQICTILIIETIERRFTRPRIYNVYNFRRVILIRYHLIDFIKRLYELPFMWSHTSVQYNGRGECPLSVNKKGIFWKEHENKRIYEKSVSKPFRFLCVLQNISPNGKFRSGSSAFRRIIKF